MKKENIVKFIKMKKRDDVAVLIIAAVVIAASGYLVLGNKSSETGSEVGAENIVAVEMLDIRSQSLGSEISVSGTVKASEEVAVSSKTSGRLTEKCVREGDTVLAGQEILKLEQDQALLVSYNNAKNNLVNTIATTNQDIHSSELAVNTAEIYLSNLGYNMTESVRSAELGVESAEIALLKAGNSLENSSVGSDEAIDDAYENAKNSMKSGFDSSRAALTSVGNVLGEYPGSDSANDSYQDLLGARNSQSFYNAKDSFFAAREKYYEEVNKFESLDRNVSHEEIDVEILKVREVFNLTKIALSDCRSVLDYTITSDRFSYSSLMSLKNGIDQNMSAMNSSVSALDGRAQAISSAKIAEKTSGDGASNAYSAAEKALESARQSLALAQSQQKTQVDAAQRALAGARSNFESVKKAAKFQIEAAQGQVDAVKAQLDYSIITSPIDGIVNEINFNQGEMVSSGMTMASIVNTSGMEVEVAVSEYEIGKLKLGEEVAIKSSLYPEEVFVGKIYYISSVADESSKKFPVKVQIINVDDRIKSGMAVNLVFSVDGQDDIITVPKTAVFEEGGAHKIYTVDGKNLVTIKNIEIEEFDSENYLVRGEIGDGDKIIVNGNYDFVDGDEVVRK
ncbi:MAG: efflux RND transporter periplasmic adaptor subunit [Candidatus Pacebacteria bacterium]|nr:efflux RND transporter periplasmic adaptor subunit [Candidatus Paceibacterota bacterium]